VVAFFCPIRFNQRAVSAPAVADGSSGAEAATAVSTDMPGALELRNPKGVFRV
jgi:hypothetical protein